MSRDDDQTFVFENTVRPSRVEAAPPGWLHARVVVLRGAEEGRTFALEESKTVLGRGKDASIVLSDPALSRHHAEIVFGGTEFRIRDLESSNGTLLNGSEVDEYALRNGDKITVGETILRFEMERSERPNENA